VRPAPRQASSIVNRSRPRKAAGRGAMTRARRSTGANATSSPILAGTWLACKSTPPTSKIAMAPPRHWPRSAISSRGCAMSLPMAPTRARSWRRRLPGAGSGHSRSSSDQIKPKVFKYCPGAGWSSGPSPGLAVIGGWRGTLRGPSRAARLGSIWLPCSCWHAALLDPAHKQ
jgi:hypothetical protein